MPRASVQTVSRPFTTATTKRTTVHPYPGDCIHTEFVLVDKQEKNQQFGVLTFQCRTFNQNGDVVIEHIDKLYVGKKSAFCAGQAG